jgi:membrane-associated phospholipid phosphatase
MLFLKNVDAAGNACPSLHAAFAVFACLWFERVLQEMKRPHWVHVANVIWALAILYSTIATRQHVAIDTLAGSLLGWMVGRVNLKHGPALPSCTASR